MCILIDMVRIKTVAKLPTVAPFALLLVLCGADVVLGTTSLSLFIIMGARSISKSGEETKIWTLLVKKKLFCDLLMQN